MSGDIAMLVYMLPLAFPINFKMGSVAATDMVDVLSSELSPTLDMYEVLAKDAFTSASVGSGSTT